jgi:hypothetical protein
MKLAPTGTNPFYPAVVDDHRTQGNPVETETNTLRSNNSKIFPVSINDLPVELIEKFFLQLNSAEIPTCQYVCRLWRDISLDKKFISKFMFQWIKDKQFVETIFTCDKWAQYFGEEAISKEDRMAEISLLPANIEKILNNPCTLFDRTGKQVKDTHILTFIPEKIHGKPLNLDSFGGLLKNLVGKRRMEYCEIDDNILKEWGKESAILGPRWVLMTKEVIPAAHCINNLTALGYDVPDPIAVAVSLITYYLHMGYPIVTRKHGVRPVVIRSLRCLLFVKKAARRLTST